MTAQVVSLCTGYGGLDAAAQGGTIEDWERCRDMSLRAYVADRRKDSRRWARQWAKDRERFRREMGLAA